jgi:Family of unknown function (DUF5329)
MTRRTHSVGRLALVLFCLAVIASPSLPAESLTAVEARKIEALIKRVETLESAAFIRNGSSYSAAEAATFLRRKWAVNQAIVTSARDFVDKVASFSGTSGQPYIIRFQDGKQVRSQEFLRAELAEMEAYSNRTSEPRIY